MLKLNLENNIWGVNKKQVTQGRVQYSATANTTMKIRLCQERRISWAVDDHQTVKHYDARNLVFFYIERPLSNYVPNKQLNNNWKEDTVFNTIRVYTEFFKM